MKEARQKASDEYNIFNKTQKITSDFDKQIKNMLDDSKQHIVQKLKTLKAEIHNLGDDLVCQKRNQLKIHSM